MFLKETEDPGAALWYEEIQSAIGLANDHAHSGLKSMLSFCYYYSIWFYSKVYNII